MHEHLFIKYINDVDVYNELKSKVKDIDVFNDVLVVLTENYLVIEKYYLDTDDILKSSPAPTEI